MFIFCKHLNEKTRHWHHVSSLFILHIRFWGAWSLNKTQCLQIQLYWMVSKHQCSYLWSSTTENTSMCTMCGFVFPPMCRSPLCAGRKANNYYQWLIKQEEKGYCESTDTDCRTFHRDSDKNNGRVDSVACKVVLESLLRHQVSALSPKYVMDCDSRKGKEELLGGMAGLPLISIPQVSVTPANIRSLWSLKCDKSWDTDVCCRESSHEIGKSFSLRVWSLWGVDNGWKYEVFPTTGENMSSLPSTHF